MEKRVLIVEDDPVSAKILESILRETGCDVEIAENGLDAISKYEKYPFLIVVTDLDMPEMNGEELIARLNAYDTPPVIFVQTVHDELPRVIEVMKLNVYDYLVKPVDTQDIRIKMNRAFAAAEMIRLKRIVEKEKIIRLENQLEWVRWKEMAGADSEIRRKDKALFHSLQTSFNQGQGFGALVTLLEMVSSSAKKDGDHFCVDAGLMELIHENVTMAANALNVFREIDWLLSNDLPLQELTCGDLYRILQETIDAAEKYAEKNNLKIRISEKKEIFAEQKVNLSEKYFYRAVYEVIINACKFSERNTDIIVMLNQRDNSIEISFLNKPVSSDDGNIGIPMGYEYILFEPFFRITKNVYEGFDTLDFGLGLTIVEKILLRHKGKVTISNIQDYTDITKGPVVKVDCVMTLPLVK